MGSNETSILKTILYSDIFDYPLTEKELHRYAIAKKPIIQKEFFNTLYNNMSSLSRKHDLFCIKGREFIFEKRLQREKIAERKMRIARRVARTLFFIPSILCIGVSGGLAMKNAKTNDDIDFFLITKDNTIWMTRFFVLVCLQLLGKRRKRRNRHVSDTICVNMLVDASHLVFSENRQDLYTAHEIVQMKPLFARDAYDKRFLSANVWVKTFLPNVMLDTFQRSRVSTIQSNKIHLYLCSLVPLQLVEFFFKNFQLWYMRRHKTVETIEQGFIAFHPKEYREFVGTEFAERLKTYDIQI